MAISELIRTKLLLRDGAFSKGLYRLMKSVQGLSMPMFKPLYLPLRAERNLRLLGWRRFRNLVYNEPIFKTYCKTYGTGLRLYDDMPKIFGRLEIHLGENVGIEGDALFAGGKISPNPVFSIGDDTYLGYQVRILVADEVSIGRHVLIANRVFFAGHDSHPLDPIQRARNEPPTENGGGPIRVEDYVWIGNNCTILKNVTIGKAAIVAIGSVVTKNVEPFTIVAGNPARVVKRLDEYRHYFEES